jgi:uncharacterized RDD family membrane protein YckC
MVSSIPPSGIKLVRVKFGLVHMTAIDEVWSRRNDEQLTHAAESLDEYTEEARAAILAELHRRNIPKPVAATTGTTGNTAVVLASPMQRFGGAVIDVLAMIGVGGLMAASHYQSLAVAYILCVGAVQIGFLVQRAQTIGKVIVGTRIVDAETHDHPGFARLVLLRTGLFNLVYRIPWLGPAFFIVDASLVFSHQHQTVHDRVARTLVVRNAPTPLIPNP